MEVHDKLDELIAIVENARSMPLSSSCVLNRGELLALLDELRQLLPEELQHAGLLLADREALLAEGRAEAEKIITAAREEQDRLVSQTEVWIEARRQADSMLADAEAESTRMRREVDDYVDTRLANFEVVLEKTLSTVRRGREKLHGRHELDELGSLADAPDLGEPAAELEHPA